MNRVYLMGRFTADPELRYSTGEKQTAVVKFTLATDRRGRDAGADFHRCVGFDKTAEFISKYFHKGSKALIEGHIQTGSYTDNDGKKVYTTDVIVDSIEFCDSKQSNDNSAPSPSVDTGFMTLPDGIDEKLPFD